MDKGLGILIGGIFIGAVGMELIHRKYPKGLSRLCGGVCGVASGAKQAFVDGYRNRLNACRNASQPEEAATESA